MEIYGRADPMNEQERIFDCIAKLENCKMLPNQRRILSSQYMVPREVVDLALDLLYIKVAPVEHKHR